MKLQTISICLPWLALQTLLTFVSACPQHDNEPVIIPSSNVTVIGEIHQPKQVRHHRRALQAPSTPSGTFKLAFHCEIKDTKLCKGVEKLVHQILTETSTLFPLRKDIIVNTMLLSAKNSTSMSPGLLAACMPRKYHTVYSHDFQSLVQIPQGLAKQLIHQKTDWEDGDIDLWINSDGWPAEMVKDGFGQGKRMIWVKEFDAEPLPEDQFDLRRTIRHELLHGLGFASSLQSFAHVAENTVAFAMKAGKVDNVELINGLAPLKVYDALLYFNGLGMYGVQLHAKMQDLIQKHPIPTSKFDQLFAKSPYGRFAHELHNNVTYQYAVTMVTKSGRQYAAETSYNPFDPVSSLSHFDGRYYVGSKEAIMMPYDVPGQTWEEVSTENIYAQGVLDVLESMGWAVNR